MTTLYIHGGMMKTGTTFLQNFLATNHALLEAQGVAFPDPGGLLPEVYNSEGPSVRRNACWLDAARTDKAVRQKGMEFLGRLSGKYEKIILSDESLWNACFDDPAFWTMVTESLQAYDITVKVIVYLRRQDTYIYSRWVQGLKTTKKENYKNESFADYLEKGYYKRHRLYYDRVLASIESVLGRENILVRVYEKGQFAGDAHDLQSDFLQAAGIPADLPFAGSGKRPNQSLKDSVLETKRYFNRIPGFDASEKQGRDSYYTFMCRTQSALEKEGLLRDRSGFSNAQRRAFLKEYEESNALTARRYLGREDGILFYEQIPDGEDEDEVFTTDELMEVCGRVIVDMHERICSLREKKDAAQALNKEYKEKLSAQEELNRQLRAQVNEQEKLIRSLQNESDGPRFKRAVKKI